MDKLIPTDSPEFFRDSKSNALLNVDVVSLNKYKKMKESQNKMKYQMDEMAKRIKELENIIRRIDKNG